MTIFSKVKKKIKQIIKPKYIPIYKTVGMDEILKNKVALITGGDGEIGMCIAKKLISAGADVIITGRNIKKLEKAVNELGHKSQFIVLDINTTIIDIQEKVENAISIYGKIDILVNCIGTHVSREDFNFVNVTENEYDKIMNTNLKGTFFICQTIVNYFIKNKISGHILFISSNRGVEPAWSPYGISKWGMNGFCKGLAKELIKYGIVVNSISPGPVASRMNDYKNGESVYSNQNSINRLILSEEVANYAIMLVSSLGDALVGDTILITGGRGTIDYR